VLTGHPATESGILTRMLPAINCVKN
jgi:hypothetical protein